MIAQKYKKKDNLFRLPFFFSFVCGDAPWHLSTNDTLVHHELHAAVLDTLVEAQDVGT